MDKPLNGEGVIEAKPTPDIDVDKIIEQLLAVKDQAGKQVTRFMLYYSLVIFA